MEISPTWDQVAVVRQIIKDGRPKERERLRFESLGSLDDVRASIKRGEGIPIMEESMRDVPM